MAKINGVKFVLLVDSEPIVCETESSINFDAVVTELRCKGTGAFSEFLEDTGVSGTLNFSGYYDDVSANQSGIDLAQKLISGAIYAFVWGGETTGDEIISGNIKLSNVNISAPTDQAVSFTGSGRVSGTPTFSTVA